MTDKTRQQELADQLKKEEAAREKRQAMIDAETDEIWRQASQEAEPSKHVLRTVSAGMYGVNDRITELVKMIQQSAVLSNICWNSFQSFIKHDVENSLKRYEMMFVVNNALQQLEGSTNEPAATGILANLLLMTEPSRWGHATEESYNEALTTAGKKLMEEAKQGNKDGSGTLESLENNIREMIFENKEQIQTNLYKGNSGDSNGAS